ncbi:MAG: VirB3 family type IV secretion system protein [Gammaproteobacteria bacterium]|nr:VirB3 family type IV secretion system protein [Gammaproteobacteria bacterium]
MRGTARQTNKALSTPILVMGAERSLIVMSCLFWGWALVGVFPHWAMFIVLLGFLATIYVLKFAAKRDAQGVAVFRANSRFLVQNRFYVARGYAGILSKIRKVNTVPTQMFKRL